MPEDPFVLLNNQSTSSMNVFQFMSESPFLTFCLCYMLTVTPWKMWKVLIRHANIRKQGWPPPHLDADGDFKPEPESED